MHLTDSFEMMNWILILVLINVISIFQYMLLNVKII